MCLFAEINLKLGYLHLVMHVRRRSLMKPIITLELSFYMANLKSNYIYSVENLTNADGDILYSEK